MKISLLLLPIIISAQLSFGQNLFEVKLKNCDTESFCLDCGDVKAGFDDTLFHAMLDKLETKLNLNGASGTVYFQVLVEADGTGCVLSHTDVTKSSISKALVKGMNKFKSWTPALRDGKSDGMTSINVAVEIKNGNLTALVKRVDMEEFERSLKRD